MKALLILTAALVCNGTLGVAFSIGVVLVIRTVCGWLGGPEALSEAAPDATLPGAPEVKA